MSAVPHSERWGRGLHATTHSRQGEKAESGGQATAGTRQGSQGVKFHGNSCLRKGVDEARRLLIGAEGSRLQLA